MPTRMLFLSPYLPAPDTHGGSVLIYQLLKRLSAEFSISLVTFVHPSDDPESIRELELLCSRVETVPFPFTVFKKLSNRLSWMRIKPTMVSYFDSDIMTRKVKQVIDENEVELAQVELLPMAQFLPVSFKAPTILHQIDVLSCTAYSRYNNSQIWKKPINFLEWVKLTAYEKQTSMRFSSIVACSDREAKVLDFHPNVKVIPHGINADYFSEVKNDGCNNPTLLFIGAFMHAPNVEGLVWFVNHIWPDLKGAISDLKLVIIGRNPPNAIMELAKERDIKLAGFVPDIRPYLTECQIFIAPLTWGSGIKIKILEAMAAGKPVVTTTVGAEGIMVQRGKHLEIAETAGEYKDSVLKLLNSEKTRKEMGSAARELIRTRYSWDNIIPLYEQLYRELPLA